MELFVLNGLKFLFIFGESIGFLPFKFLVYLSSNKSLSGNDDEEYTAQYSPVNDSAVISQVKVSVSYCGAFSKGDDEPHGNVDNFEEVYAILDVAEGLLIVQPVNLAEDVQNVDGNPDEEVADGR